MEELHPELPIVHVMKSQLLQESGRGRVKMNKLTKEVLSDIFIVRLIQVFARRECYFYFILTQILYINS
jgi:hypothetical protein